MEATFAECHGVLENINTLFGSLERNRGHSNEKQLEDSIRLKLESLKSKFERIDQFILKEAPNKRQALRLRLDQLKYDSSHVQAALRTFQNKRLAKEREQQEREELLSRRFTTNVEDTSIDINHSLQHHSSMQRANRGVDDLISQGYEVLGNLRDQKQMLKNTRTRMLNFLNTLGLSNTVIQMVERRASEDKYILIGGMCVTIFVVLVLYFYIL